MLILLLLEKLQQGLLGRCATPVHQMFFLNTFSLVFSYLFKYIKNTGPDCLAVFYWLIFVHSLKQDLFLPLHPPPKTITRVSVDVFPTLKKKKKKPNRK